MGLAPNLCKCFVALQQNNFAAFIRSTAKALFGAGLGLCQRVRAPAAKPA